MQVTLLVEESALSDVYSDQLLMGKLYINQFGSIAMHELTKVMISHAKSTFSVKKMQPSKVESYMK